MSDSAPTYSGDGDCRPTEQQDRTGCGHQGLTYGMMPGSTGPRREWCYVSSSLVPCTGFWLDVCHDYRRRDRLLLKGVARLRINKDDVICGLAASDARDVMRLFGSPKRADLLHEWTDDVESLAQSLETVGFFQRRSVDANGGVWWETTIKGNALAQASFRRPISRATANRHLESVIERAKAYNTDKKHIFEITQIVVFGSYLDPEASQLGDLDLAIVTRERPMTASLADDLSQRSLDYADASGRQFNSFFDRLGWAEREVVQILRNRVAAISITRNDVSTFTDRWEIVYTYRD
jgi:predicted nucleotidyltransferase